MSKLWKTVTQEAKQFELQYTDYPIFSTVRYFMGLNELVLLYFTKRCRYQCSFCSLPLTSSRTDVGPKEIYNQLLASLSNSRDLLDEVEAVAFGNEGSIFDQKTFSKRSLAENMNLFESNEKIKRVSVETRHEFVGREEVEFFSNYKFDQKIIKVGFETYTEEVRSSVLNKPFSNKSFLEFLDKLVGTKIIVSAYVLIHCDYRKKLNSGLAEARKTCEFLVKECANRGIPLILRLNPMYGAAGMPWTRKAIEHNWRPPSISETLEIAADFIDFCLACHIGLSDEGLAQEGMSFLDIDGKSTAFTVAETYNENQDVWTLKEWKLRKR